MQNIELLFQDFLKENLSSGVCRQDDVFLLNGCRQLYEAAGEGVYRELFMRSMDSIVDGNGSLFMQDTEAENRKLHNAGMGNNLFWMAEHTGEEKYKAAVEKQIALLKAGYAQLPESDQTDGRGLYLTQPFYMEYETKCHKKAEYKQIVQRMDRKKKTEEPAETEAGRKDVCWYLMALADLLGCMSMEIYEYYRFLEEKLKTTIRLYAGCKNGLPYGEEKIVCSMWAYVILRACNQKNLNAEKYGGIGREMLKGVLDSASLQNCEEAGLLMMAYAQLLLFDAKTDFM